MSLKADSEPPPHSRQSHVWEQKVGVVSPEEPLAPEVSTPLPPLPPEPGGSGEGMVMGQKGSQETPKEELGLRPRINLRGIMRSISLLEPSSEPESTTEAGDLPEVSLGWGALQERTWDPTSLTKTGRCHTVGSHSLHTDHLTPFCTRPLKTALRI